MHFARKTLWSVLGLGLCIFNISTAPAKASSQSTPTNPYHCDLAKTGTADILWRNTTTGQVVAWYMNGTETPTTATVSPTVSDLNWDLGVCADFLGTGNADLGWGLKTPPDNYTTELSLWLENNITLQSADYYSIPSGWNIEDVVDLNGAGQLDLLFRNKTTGEHVVWYLNSSAAVQSTAVLTTLPTYWKEQETGDFNGDGHADLLWSNNNTSGNYAIWLMNNTTVLSAAQYQVPSGWYVAQVADFNGDGKSDLLWQNYDTGQVVVWFMDGTTVTSTASLPGVGAGWCAAGADDYGNGHVDIFWYNLTTGQTEIWLLNGSTSLSVVSSGALPSVPPSTWYPVAGTSNCH